MIELWQRKRKRKVRKKIRRKRRRKENSLMWNPDLLFKIGIVLFFIGALWFLSVIPQ